MRIIAGVAKGNQIFAPKGQDTRPTQDRVRESLFNILQSEIPGASVLDLFAGSGALALEAVSRGAEEAVMVDSGAEAMNCIQRNIAKLGFGEKVQTLKCDWRAALHQLHSDKRAFDLVFLDPPYQMLDTAGIIEDILEAGLLRPKALMIVEHRKGMEPKLMSPFHSRRKRKYGDTEISFFDYEQDADAEVEEG